MHEDDCLSDQVTLLGTESYLCAALPVVSSQPSFPLMQEENTPVSASDCHTDEMMPKYLQTEVNPGVRLAKKSHLSPQYNSV